MKSEEKTLNCWILFYPILIWTTESARYKWLSCWAEWMLVEKMMSRQIVSFQLFKRLWNIVGFTHFSICLQQSSMLWKFKYVRCKGHLSRVLDCPNMQNAHEGDICLTGERAADFEYTNTNTNTNRNTKTNTNTNVNTNTNTNTKTITNTTTDTNTKNSQKHKMHKKMIFAGRKK